MPSTQSSTTSSYSIDLEQQEQHPMTTKFDTNGSVNGSKTLSNGNKIDFSYCILWSPLPLITWIIPFIGHLGIADSNGISHDFQGPYTIGRDASAIPRMAFGPTTRYLKMDIGNLLDGAERWDEAINEADRIYSSRIHNICCDNCHSHVAKALNLMPYGRSQWNMVKLCFLVVVKGSFVGISGFLAQFLPFTILVIFWVILT